MPSVLLVDDDPDLRETLRTLLEEEGYAVREAHHGAEALDVLREADEPVVVLLDVVLPQVSGIHVLSLVPGDAQLRRHAFVICTAHPESVPSELRDALAVPILEKPFELDVLLTAVSEAAERLNRNESR